jgi:hypothetical protein
MLSENMFSGSFPQLDGETLRLIMVLKDGANVRVAEYWNGGTLERYSYYWLTTGNGSRSDGITLHIIADLAPIHITSMLGPRVALNLPSRPH